MNFVEILAAAKRAQAAYIEDLAAARAAFEALGYAFLGQYQDLEHQAVLSRGADGRIYLSISGTRFSDGELGDLFEDIDLTPVAVGDGAEVSAGAYNGLGLMWAWAVRLAPAYAVFNVEGHSLGAWRTRYTPLFLPQHQIGALHSFESPKAGNAAFWQKYDAELTSLVSVVNGLDLWVGWPFLGEWCQRPRDEVWLSDTGFQVITPDKWPGARRISDHDVDLVVTRLQQIASQGDQLAAAVT